MNIHELEKRTGITKQNIRFYEKKGLLHPERNQENNYREYEEEDVTALKMIKLLRKLDISIEDIRKILAGEEALGISARRQTETLLARRSQLDAAIKMCRILADASYDTVNVESMLSQMDDLERKGGKFMNIINDYKHYAKTMTKKEFRFIPDNMLLTKEEFTEALFQYGRENDLDIVVTHEGLSPIFEIDGIEYQASRIYGRFGAVVQCTMTHPEELEEELKEMSQGRKKYIRVLYRILPALIILFCFVLYLAVSRGIENLWICLLAMCSLVTYLGWYCFRYTRLK